MVLLLSPVSTDLTEVIGHSPEARVQRWPHSVHVWERWWRLAGHLTFIRLAWAYLCSNSNVLRGQLRRRFVSRGLGLGFAQHHISGNLVAKANHRDNPKQKCVEN